LIRRARGSGIQYAAGFGRVAVRLEYGSQTLDANVESLDDIGYR
jgi:hypothetical protein